MTGLFRRGGVWWCRLTVPERLRALAGRREFVRSTGAHDLAVGKLVGAVLLADWRRRLFDLERGQVNDENVLKLVEGAPALAAGGFVTLGRAAELSGLDQGDLVRAVAAGRLALHCRVGRGAGAGFEVPIEALEPIDPGVGPTGGTVIPGPGEMPGAALAANVTGQVLTLTDGPDVAGAILADGLDVVELVALEAPARPGWWFCPDAAIRVEVGALEVSAAEVEALRVVVAAAVPPERVEDARAARKSAIEGKGASGGKWAGKRFSEGLDAYAKQFLPQKIANPKEIERVRVGIGLFIELVGDLPLADVDLEVLRLFRDGPLSTVLARANQARVKFGTTGMADTIAAAKAAGVDWPIMSPAERDLRMQWIGRMFEWLHAQGWIRENPALGLKGESVLSLAEQKRAKQEQKPREPFTTAELRVIFGQPWFMTGRGEMTRAGTYREFAPFQFWLPLLGVYLGARVGELAQLHLGDIGRTEAGTWYVDINARTPDKSLKNDQSARLVPLHPALVEAGFIEWCERLRAEGFRRLFPELSWGPVTRYSKAPVRAMSAMLEGLGMARDGTRVSHSFRHVVNNALVRRDKPMPELMRRRVLGHEAGEDVNVLHYLADFGPDETAVYIKALDFGLPPIARFDIDAGVKAVKDALSRKKGARRGLEDLGPLTRD